ncbi:MAG: PQQ-binding-like beta-propeller repeat protein, partial [Gemmatimonadota bacterium]|nr:PQQ-binding-like beta-propeller repeat protein [Gemmatimonadota bacterium]
MKSRSQALAATVLLTAWIIPAPAASQRAVTYTAEQAAAGAAAYEEHCAGCHLSTMAGSFEAPQLAGPNFLSFWGDEPVDGLLEMTTLMPPDAEGSLGDEVYANIVAYILSRNGFPMGGDPLTMASNGILSGATGVSATVAAPTAGRGGGGGGRGSAGRSGPPPGGTETYAAITNFRPVSDAELASPNAGDWLMYRRTYDAQGYSPLDQIDRGNVADLSLAWVWAMDEGSSQPTPLVRDGVMYLTHPENKIQAIDAASGELLWEYRRDFPEGYPGGGFTHLRSIAIRDDKIYIPTKDAALVAISARTGEQIWETRVADFTKGYTYVAGPLVVRGKVISGINGCGQFYEDSCFITAHDAETGAELWRTYTIPRPGEPGDDTWGDLPFELRGGVDAWITGSYDPQLDLIYWGT